MSVIICFNNLGFRGIYFLYQFVFSSKSGFKNLIDELIVSFLDLEDSETIECLRSVALKPLQKTTINIVHGSSGGLALSKGSQT